MISLHSNRRCTFPSYTKCATNSFILPKKSENPDDEEPDSHSGTPNSHRDRRRRTGAGQLDGRPSSGHQPKLGKPNVKLKRPYLFQQLKKRNKEKVRRNSFFFFFFFSPPLFSIDLVSYSKVLHYFYNLYFPSHYILSTHYENVPLISLYELLNILFISLAK